MHQVAGRNGPTFDLQITGQLDTSVPFVRPGAARQLGGRQSSVVSRQSLVA